MIAASLYMCTKCPKAERNCDNCEYMVALKNYYAALREFEEESDKFEAYLKKTYNIDFYN